MSNRLSRKAKTNAVAAMHNSKISNNNKNTIIIKFAISKGQIISKGSNK